MNKIIIAIISVLVILLAGLGFYYVFKEEPKNTYESYDQSNTQSYNETSSYDDGMSSNNSNDMSSDSSNDMSNTSSNDMSSDSSNDMSMYDKAKKDLNKEAKKQIFAKPAKTSQNQPTKSYKELKKLGFSCLDKKDLLKEYRCKGKDATYVNSLSDHYLHIYFENGLIPTKYRLKLLKELFANIKSKSKDYNLTIFVKMLPNLSMDLSIYNKDIIFADRKKYEYVYKQKPMDFKLSFKNNAYKNFKGEKELLAYTKSFKRDEVLKRVFIEVATNKKGSRFANFLLGLNRGSSVAAYFFPLSEAIYIHSFGKGKNMLKLYYKN